MIIETTKRPDYYSPYSAKLVVGLFVIIQMVIFSGGILVGWIAKPNTVIIVPANPFGDATQPTLVLPPPPHAPGK